MNIETFVKNYMKATNCKHNLDEILNLIREEARKKAQNGCTVFDEEDVEKIIDNADKLLKDKSQKSSKPTEVKPQTTKINQKKEYKKVETPNVKPTQKHIAKSTSKKISEPLDSEFDFEQLGLF